MLRSRLYTLFISMLLASPQYAIGEDQDTIFIHSTPDSIHQEHSCETTHSHSSCHQIIVGPQWIYLNRKRDGGVRQNGNLYGGYFTYNRLKRYGWYLGAEGSYATSTLKGDSDGGDRLRSKFKDLWIEGRVGYTFQKKAGYKWGLTPYVGVGYAQEQNNFTASSPIPVHFKSHFYYPSLGVRLGVAIGANVSSALNFRVRYPYEPKCKVSHDPENTSVEQKMGEKLQYRIELPVTYTSSCYNPWGISICPFYEYRPYGNHVNYPFDYFKTTLTLWGVGLGLKW